MIRAGSMLEAGAGVLASLLAIALISACGQSMEARGTVSDTTQISDRGGELFRGHCAACHGHGGEGQPNWNLRKSDGLLPAPPLNGDGHTWHHGDGTLYRIVSRGGAIYESPDLPGYKSGMPSFGDKLTHDEIVAVITYVKSLWKDKVAQGLGLPIRESQAIVSETDPFPESGQ